VIDYFAVLGQPRRPWLDPKKLEAKYHELARRSHPDSGSPHEVEFTGLNEAYRCLRNPKLRLQHLLTVAGNPPTRRSEVAPDLAELFTKISSALAQGSETEIDALVTAVERQLSHALQQLQALNERWRGDSADLMRVEDFYRRFSFLSRWKDLLDEFRFRRV
jgi:curved DNA-binding protein CbpA